MPQTIKKNHLIDSIYFSYAFNLKSLEGEWMQASGSNLYLSTHYLQALEQSLSKQIQFLYVVLYQEEKPIGVVYFQRIKIGKEFFNQEKFPDEIHTKNTSAILKRVRGSMLLCGNFFATGTHGYSFLEELPSATLTTLVSKLNKLFYCIKTHSFKFVMFKEFWLDSQQTIQQELKTKNAVFQIDVNMILYLQPTWNCFEDYLGAMVTKYRTRVKSVYKKTALIEERELSLSEIKNLETEIHKLYNAVLNTASFNLVRLAPDTFYHLKHQLKNHFIFKGYFINNQLVSFSTACVNNTYLDANYVGINYAVNKEYPLYQRILYDYVKLTFQQKKTELRLGRTAEIMKSSLGAVPKPMNLYVKHSNPILHNLLKPLVRYVKPSQYEIRKPFKREFTA